MPLGLTQIAAALGSAQGQDGRGRGTRGRGNLSVYTATPVSTEHHLLNYARFATRTRLYGVQHANLLLELQGFYLIYYWSCVGPICIVFTLHPPQLHATLSTSSYRYRAGIL